jgi:Mg-chelatase subunit ChlD
MLTIPPDLMLRNESSSEDAEILFVADRSGSMVDKVESLKSAMVFVLKSIPQGHKFNVWCFGGQHTLLWLQSQNYSDQTIGAPLSFVQTQCEADIGGTELSGALQAIISARDQIRMADNVILTDGGVWRLDDTVDIVRETRDDTGGRVKSFILGVGSAVSHAPVEDIAKAGGGYEEVIPAAGQGGWEDRVDRYAERDLGWPSGAA